MLPRFSPPTFLALALATSLLAADPTPPPPTPTPKPTPTNAENTGRNARDTKPGAVLPTDQSNKPEDLKATQDIRKAVMADKALSVNAKNAKIITTETMVVLRGPVDSQAEREQLNKYAKASAGSREVRDELEVRATK